MCMIRKASPKEEPKIEEPRAQEDDKWVNLTVTGKYPKNDSNLSFAIAIATGKNVKLISHTARGQFEVMVKAVSADNVERVVGAIESHIKRRVKYTTEKLEEPPHPDERGCR